jgi:endonuclease/exonuclease/phosphatase (EEP) superfamily protein YafD
MWSVVIEELEAIQKASRLKYAYYSPVFSYEIMGEEVHFGNGILSNIPYQNEETVFTHGSYRKVSSKSHTPNMRNAQIVTYKVDDSELTVVNYHAHWENDGMGSELSLKRLKPLVEKIKNIQGPLVVAGDFNLWVDSPALKFFIKELGLKSLTSKNSITNTLDSHATSWEVACDHIFVSDDILVNSFKVEDKFLSDHKALLLDFEIKRR